MRRFLQQEGIDTATPKNTLRQAYRRGLLDREPLWLDMLKDRNLTSHTYQEALALEIYRRIPEHHAAMRAAFDRLREQLPG